MLVHYSFWWTKNRNRNRKEATLLYCCEGAGTPASRPPSAAWGWGERGGLKAGLGPEAEKGGGDGEAGPASVYAARAPHKEEWIAKA